MMPRKTSLGWYASYFLLLYGFGWYFQWLALKSSGVLLEDDPLSLHERFRIQPNNYNSSNLRNHTTMPKQEPMAMACDNNNANSKKELGFLHIPKTGGSSIEVAAQEHAQKQWGYFAWKQQQTQNTRYIRGKYLSKKFRSLQDVLFWHLPATLLNPMLKKAPPTKGQDLFAVIRNPYSRIASEVFHKCRDTIGHGGQSDRCFRKTTVNRRLQQILKEQRTCIQQLNLATMEKETLQCLFKEGHHFLPQHWFFYNHSSGERQVKYLLHFESLAQDFANLMQEHSLDIVLNDTTRVRQSNYTKQKSYLFGGVRDFDKTTLYLIRDLYRMDFELGGYSLDPNDAAFFEVPTHWGDGPTTNTTFWELPCKIPPPREK